MKTTLTHELYKMVHQRSSWIAIIVLFGLMLYSATPVPYIDKNLISQGFGAGQWSIIIAIALSANFVAMEFRDNTMPTLLYKSQNRWSVFISKFIALIIYNLFLLICSFTFAIILKLILVNDKFTWNTVYHGYTLIMDLCINLAGVAIYLLFIITFSLMLIVMVKSSAIVIVVGLFIGFLGSTFSDVFMKALPGLKSILAWNPLNMINIIVQLSNTSISKTSALTDGELITGTLIYSIIFLLIGIYAFNKRRL